MDKFWGVYLNYSISINRIFFVEKFYLRHRRLYSPLKKALERLRNLSEAA